MKKINVNQNKYFQTFCVNLYRLIIILVVSQSCLTLSAQNGKTVNPRVMEVNNYISSLKGSAQKTRANESEAASVEKLVFGIQSAIYFQSGIVKNYGTTPVKLFTDITSLSNLSNSAIAKDDIQIIVIDIKNRNDLGSKIDLNMFSNYQKLKYIYFTSVITINEATILNMLSNNKGQYAIFYNIETGQ